MRRITRCRCAERGSSIYGDDKHWVTSRNLGNKTTILNKKVKTTNEKTHENDYITLTHNWMDNMMTIYMYAQNRQRD